MEFELNLYHITFSKNEGWNSCFVFQKFWTVTDAAGVHLFLKNLNSFIRVIEI